MFYLFYLIRLSLLFFIIFFTSSCVSSKKIHDKTSDVKKESVIFTKTDFAHIEKWHNDDHYAAVKSFLHSCNSINMRKSSSNISSYTPIGGKVIIWQKACDAALKVKNKEEAKLFWEKRFVPYKVSSSIKGYGGTFTGYYSMEILASRKRTEKFRYPVYKTPPNIKQLKGKHIISRAAINAGSLRAKGLEIAWVAHPGRLFFMHTQGSGILRFEDGTKIRLEYADRNGFKFRYIGPYFKKYGVTKNLQSQLDKMKWLDENPKIGIKIMNNNPSYIFFKEVKDLSAKGSKRVPLTSCRSIAVDRRIFPYGTPLWVKISEKNGNKGFDSIFIAQDRGGAVLGAVRGDIFFGHDETAERLACAMNGFGSYYALFPYGVYISKVHRFR